MKFWKSVHFLVFLLFICFRMYFALRFFLLSLFVLITFHIFVAGWRQDRSKYYNNNNSFLEIFKICIIAGPIFMGDKIPLKSLIPHGKRVQKKIVLYHNYFRTKVIPRASNMLKMVRAKYVKIMQKKIIIRFSVVLFLKALIKRCLWKLWLLCFQFWF